MLRKFLFTRDKYNKVYEYLSNNIFYEPNIQQLFSQCKKYGDVYLIGGTIKDIAFFDRKPKDFDIIITYPNKIELDLSDCFKINLNSFGGYKILYKELIFDIWNCKDERDIFNTSIKFNVDGLYINLSKDYYKDKLFNQSIQEGIIKLINNKNMHPVEGRDYERGLKLVKEFGLKYKYS